MFSFLLSTLFLEGSQAEFFFKIRQMKAGQNKKYDIAKTSGFVQGCITY